MNTNYINNLTSLVCNPCSSNSREVYSMTMTHV